MWLDFRLYFPTCNVVITYTLHILFHFRLIKIFMQHIQSLNNTKITPLNHSHVFYIQVIHA